ncbi:flagellar biosynthetic protein FliO [Ralstonia pseudosolanacearum]
MLDSSFSAFANGACVRRLAARVMLLGVLALSGLHAVAQTNAPRAPASVGASQSSAPDGVKGNTERLPDSIPLRREAGTEHGAISGTPQLLVVVAVLGALLWWLLKRFRANASQERRPGLWPVRPTGRFGSGGLRVVNSSRLTSKASLHVVDWGGQQWLVGCTENGLSVLGKRSDDATGVEGSKREVGEHG